MREFLLIPTAVVSIAILLPLILISLIPLSILMWIAEKNGTMKLGGIHRETQDIGMWN